MKQQKEEKRKDMGYYVKSVIGLLLMFGFGYLPPMGPLSPLGMQILGIFVGLVFLLCTVDIVWPSMVALVAFGMTDYCTVTEAIASGFGSDMVWMMLVLLVLAEGIGQSGMGEIVARWIITRKVLNKRPFLFTFVYMMGFGVCSLLVTSNVTVIMSWAIFYNIADMVGYKKGERYSTMMIIGCFLSCIMYEGLFAFQSWLLALSETFKGMTGYGINYVTYFVLGFIILGIMLALITAAMKYVFKCDFDKLNNVDFALLKGEGEMKLNFQHKFYFLCFGLIVAYVFTTTLLPAQWPVIALLNKISQAGWFAFVLCLAMIVRWKNKPVLDFPEIAAAGLNWNILMMCAAIMPIARALTSDDTGMKTLLSNVLSPVLSGMSPVVFLISIMVIMMILTNVGSNMATGIVMVTVVIPFVQGYYFSPALVGMIIIFIANMGFILPGSSGMAPYLYGNKWVTVKDIYKYGLIYCGLFLLSAIPVYLIASYII
ncbi:MAG: SLC13 family permease [Enterocloster asparagiformis]|nr:SLC13 family permease [Enterocloster asparagiformis]